MFLFARGTLISILAFIEDLSATKLCDKNHTNQDKLFYSQNILHAFKILDILL